jgi:predicted  nucleic acid-binding Zn-ribbon protein
VIQLSQSDLIEIRTALVRSYDLLRAQDEKLVDFEHRIRSVETQLGANRSDIRLIGHREVASQQKINELERQVQTLKETVAVLTTNAKEADKRMDRIVTPVWAAIATVLVGAIWMLLSQPLKPVRATPKTVALPDPPAQLSNHPACR